MAWKIPKWMDKYVELLREDREDLEQAMNCKAGRDGCDIVVNAPRALMCLARSTKVNTLLTLHEDGFLK